MQIRRGKKHADSRQPVATESRLQSPVAPCGVCGAWIGTGTKFFQSTSVFGIHRTVHRDIFL